jgi:Phosphotransferase enzyme family
MNKMNNQPSLNSIYTEKWIESKIGKYQIVGAYRTTSQRTGVWHIQGKNGRYFYKINRRKYRWSTEVFVYKNWVFLLEPYSPKLIAVYKNENNPGILITGIQGKILEETDLDDSKTEKAYFMAGKVLRRLNDSMENEWFGCIDENGLPIDFSGKPLSIEKQHNLPGQKYEILADLLHNGELLGCFNKSEKDIIQWAMESVDCYSSEKTIPTSEDYTPGNWLVDNDGELQGIIDYENMLWGDRMFPYSRLINDYFHGHPRLEESFHMGYGKNLPKEEPIQANIASAIFAAHYVTLGKNKNNEGYISRGRLAFTRIHI